MSTEPRSTDDRRTVELPAPTVAPLVMSLGIALAAAGVATSMVFTIVGGALAVLGLGIWIGQLLPGRGHLHEPAAEPGARPQPARVRAGGVEHLQVGMPGYRLRLPERVHPLSAGIKGGLVGGMVMPLPAMAYGVLSGHGIWWSINLLAGMVLPGVDDMGVEQLEQFHATLLVVGAVIHVCVSLILGLMYGVLMPMLPHVRKPLAWGAVLMPLFWTLLSYVALGIVNPHVRDALDWPWFVVSQFIFGIVAALVFVGLEKRGAIVAGLLGGVAGGLLMPLPAFAWALLTRHSIWYPVNLLAAMFVRQATDMSMAELEPYDAQRFVAALITHAILSLSFGLAFGVVLPLVPRIPAPMVWGGLVMPMMWTAASYGLMGVVNPVLQEYIDWPWFVASQFVFGIVAAIVVMRSEQIEIPPAGRGPDRSEEFLTS